MSVEYIHRIRFVKVDEFIQLQVVAESNNVYPHMTSWEIARDSNFERFGRPMPITSTPEDLREWIEEKAEGFSGGGLRRRRKWVSGEEAYGWLSRRLKSDLDIALPPCRRHKIVWGGISGRILQGREQVTIPPIKKGHPVTYEVGCLLAQHGIALRVDIFSSIGVLVGTRCRIGNTHDDTLFVVARGRRTMGYNIHERGGYTMRASESFAGLFVAGRESIPSETFDPTSSFEIGHSPYFVLIRDEKEYLSQGFSGGVSCSRFTGPDGRRHVLVHDKPVYLTEANAQQALARIRAEYPESTWRVVSGAEFAEILVEGWLLAA